MADTQDYGVGRLIDGLMGVALVVLKLTHVISWSWWLVTLPFWGGLALGLAIAVLILLVVAIKAVVG